MIICTTPVVNQPNYCKCWYICGIYRSHFAGTLLGSVFWWASTFSSNSYYHSLYPGPFRSFLYLHGYIKPFYFYTFITFDHSHSLPSYCGGSIIAENSSRNRRRFRHIGHSVAHFMCKCLHQLPTILSLFYHYNYLYYHHHCCPYRNYHYWINENGHVSLITYPYSVSSIFTCTTL